MGMPFPCKNIYGNGVPAPLHRWMLLALIVAMCSVQVAVVRTGSVQHGIPAHHRSVQRRRRRPPLEWRSSHLSRYTGPIISLKVLATFPQRLRILK